MNTYNFTSISHNTPRRRIAHKYELGKRYEVFIVTGVGTTWYNRKLIARMYPLYSILIDASKRIEMQFATTDKWRPLSLNEFYG